MEGVQGVTLVSTDFPLSELVFKLPKVELYRAIHATLQPHCLAIYCLDARLRIKRLNRCAFHFRRKIYQPENNAGTGHKGPKTRLIDIISAESEVERASKGVKWTENSAAQLLGT